MVSGMAEEPAEVVWLFCFHALSYTLFVILLLSAAALPLPWEKSAVNRSIDIKNKSPIWLFRFIALRHTLLSLIGMAKKNKKIMPG